MSTAPALKRPPTLQHSSRPAARGPVSVKNALPQTAQNDPQQFPAYEYQEFPKMVKDRKTNKPFVDPESRQIAVVYNEDEEAEYLAYYPQACVTVNRSTSADDVERMEQENASLRARLAKLENSDEAAILAADEEDESEPAQQPPTPARPAARKPAARDDQPKSAVAAPEDAEEGSEDAQVVDETDQPEPQRAAPVARVPIRSAARPPAAAAKPAGRPMVPPRRQQGDLPENMG